ncbi:MAG TPA: recombinase family protein [Verrucomicrobiae bacterium]|nr:recombinase family protein [Verrucomicrobiae bacterium]
MKKKQAALYLRVSKAGQKTQNQALELRRVCERQGWRISKVYEDAGISGATRERPALDQMLADASERKFDVVLVWKIDRLARSTSHLVDILMRLKTAEVGFCSATEAIDTTSPQGRMLLTFLGAIAEFERELISERIKAGLSRTRSNGTRLGRPRVGFDLARALRLRDSGLGYKQVARQLNVPRTTLYRGLRAIPKSPAKAVR